MFGVVTPNQPCNTGESHIHPFVLLNEWILRYIRYSFPLMLDLQLAFVKKEDNNKSWLERYYVYHSAPAEFLILRSFLDRFIGPVLAEVISNSGKGSV